MIKFLGDKNLEESLKGWIYESVLFKSSDISESMPKLNLNLVSN